MSRSLTRCARLEGGKMQRGLLKECLSELEGGTARSPDAARLLDRPRLKSARDRLLGKE